MRIQSMSFDDNGEGVEPKSLTVEITTKEAVWIGKNAGKQQGSSPHNEIYSSLTGDFFNRFWEDGINDAERDYPCKTQDTVKWDEVVMHEGMLKEVIASINESVNVSLVADLKKLIK